MVMMLVLLANMIKIEPVNVTKLREISTMQLGVMVVKMPDILNKNVMISKKEMI